MPTPSEPDMGAAFLQNQVWELQKRVTELEARLRDYERRLVAAYAALNGDRGWTQD